jgi:hypothetical protein
VCESFVEVRPRAERLSRRRSVELLLGGSVAALTGWRVWTRAGNQRGVFSIPIRRVPVEVVSYFPPARCALSRDAGVRIAEKLRMREDMSYSDVLHWLRVFAGQGSTRCPAGQAENVLGDFTDSWRLGRRFGAPSALVRTPHGARYLTAPASAPVESRRGRALHAYQTPAVFGEIGVASDLAIRVGETTRSVAELVSDCLLNFQLREVSEFEPEWATTVLALYLPPVDSWDNRWGERVTFDSIASFLVERDIGRFSCQGTHLLSALGLLLQVNRRFSLLSRVVAQKVADVCQRLSQTTLPDRLQADGSWGSDWTGDDPHIAVKPWHAVHITGHILECQILLRPEHQAPAACLERSLLFLAQAMSEVTASDVARAYCPYSHAGRVLLRWRYAHA